MLMPTRMKADKATLTNRSTAIHTSTVMVMSTRIPMITGMNQGIAIAMRMRIVG